MKSEAKTQEFAFQTFLTVLRNCDPEKQLKVDWHYFSDSVWYITCFAATIGGMTGEELEADAWDEDGRCFST